MYSHSLMKLYELKGIYLVNYIKYNIYVKLNVSSSKYIDYWDNLLENNESIDNIYN